MNKEEKNIIKFLNKKHRNYKIKSLPNNIYDWQSISRYQILSEDFMEKYKDEIDWTWISIFQNLSENFIEKYKNYVNWNWISKHQKLSYFFIFKMRDYVRWNIIERKYNITKKEFIIKYAKSVNRKETNVFTLNI